MNKKPIILKDYSEDAGTVYVRFTGGFSFHVEPSEESLLAVFKERFNPEFLPKEVHHTIIPIQFEETAEFDLLTDEILDYLCSVARPLIESEFESYLASDSLYFDLIKLTESISEIITDLGGMAISLLKNDLENK